MIFALILKQPHDVSGQNRDYHGRWETGSGLKPYEVISAHLKEYGLDNFDSRSFRENWLEHLPNTTPKEFFENMFGKEEATKENLRGGIKQFKFEEGTLKMDSTNCDVHGAVAMEYNREFNFLHKPPNVYHAILNLTKESQAGGAVKKMFKACVPMYRRMGIKNIATTPSLEMGAYAWAKYGFKYESHGTMEAHTKDMQHRMKLAKISSADPELTPNAHAEMQAVEKILGTKHLEKLWALTDIKTPHLDAHYSDVIKSRVTKNPTFSKWLMDWTHYHAILPLTEAPAMTRLAKYVTKVQ